ncbi:MAG: hypothetical protein IT378_17510 [Sandaracinaceae bacterium]|nr:hypothetical protein [Sandaracinaceae bacterium]
MTVRAQGNFLVIDGSVWRTELGRWSDRLAYRPLRLATIFARMRLDVELRRYVGALPRLDEQSVVARAGELPAGGYVAMAAADVDMDGRTELVMVRAADVTVLRVSPARGALRIEHVARLDFPSGTPTAPSRRRRVVASARGDGDGVVLRTSEHARTFRLGWQEDHPELAPAQSSCAQDLFPMGDACARLVEGRDFFEPRVLERGVEHETPGSFYTRVARPIRTAEGGTVLYEAIVTPHGRLAARAGDRPIGAAGYGASLALADLDDDGSPELLTSSARNVGAGDQLALLRILPRGALHVVWRSPELEGSVLVTCAADVDDDGVEEMLAIEEPAGTGARARLWVLR